jgi:glycosyltransferase involved in cell wall biosynthesis
VSVVVVTRDEREKLLACLDSLHRQEGPPERVEIIVVDDGSSDGSAEAVRRAFPGVQVLGKPPSGADNSRPLGIAAASGELLAFIDADCTASPRWLAGLAEALGGRGLPVVGGRILHPGGFWARMIGLSDFGEFQGLREKEVSNIPTCNMGAQRAIFDRFRFHERLAVGGDVLFCHHLRQAGIRLSYDPRILVHHHPRTDRRAFLQRAQRYGEGFVAVRRLDPSLPGGRLVALGLPGVVAATFARCLLDTGRLLLHRRAAGVALYELPLALLTLLGKRVYSLGGALRGLRAR